MGRRRFEFMERDYCCSARNFMLACVVILFGVATSAFILSVYNKLVFPSVITVDTLYASNIVGIEDGIAAQAISIDYAKSSLKGIGYLDADEINTRKLNAAYGSFNNISTEIINTNTIVIGGVTLEESNVQVLISPNFNSTNITSVSLITNLANITIANITELHTGAITTVTITSENINSSLIQSVEIRTTTLNATTVYGNLVNVSNVISNTGHFDQLNSTNAYIDNMFSQTTTSDTANFNTMTASSALITNLNSTNIVVDNLMVNILTFNNVTYIDTEVTHTTINSEYIETKFLDSDEITTRSISTPVLKDVSDIYPRVGNSTVDFHGMSIVNLGSITAGSITYDTLTANSISSGLINVDTVKFATIGSPLPYPKLWITGDGTLNFGNGSSPATDVYLSKVGVRSLKIGSANGDTNLYVDGISAGNGISAGSVFATNLYQTLGNNPLVKLPSILYKATTQYNGIATAYTMTIRANSLTTEGDKVEFRCVGRTANTASDKSIGITISGATAIGRFVANTLGVFKFEADLVRTWSNQYTLATFASHAGTVYAEEARDQTFAGWASDTTVTINTYANAADDVQIVSCRAIVVATDIPNS